MKKVKYFDKKTNQYLPVVIPKIILNKDNFTSALNYMELEDLVYTYIINENPNYILYPSKCKATKIKYEFTLLDKNCKEKEITCQVKNNLEFIEKIKKLNPDVICVVAYGKILPKEILDIPKYGCINVHASLLPKYRGAAPIQWAVLNGDKTTGVTTMYMDVGMDTGDMILKQEVEIGENETTGELWDRLSIIGADLLVKTLKQIEKGTAPRIKQSDDFTMAPMLNKEISKIDWQEKTAKQIKNLVRGLNPIMGAYSYLNGKKIKFWKVEVEEDTNSNQENGTVIKANDKDGLYIKAKDGILKIIEIQGENAKRMNANDFLRGNKIEIGQKFE